MNKSEIVAAVKAEFDRRLLELKEQTLALQHDVANESKSSAGDKHETARAMMNLEQEKLERQYQELMTMKDRFDKINFESPIDKIQLGSLIETNKGFFLLSVGLGKVKTNKQDLMLLSLQSPLGEVLFGKRVGDFVMLNKHEYIVIKVI
ncbi:MAG: 3-oxoacyl-ACP synthase [Bacteroidia bacterium]|jgi:transcription elongation GreA/GreB family factor|nr:3-oxoacyl-ACP synthase [Bacteroidia bacterium]MBP7244876.1 3-oxoacyl-ACP synthase [Bacteroidia bacterium]